MTRVRFLNSKVEGNGLTSEQQALQLVQQVKFSGTFLSPPLPTFSASPLPSPPFSISHVGEQPRLR